MNLLIEFPKVMKNVYGRKEKKYMQVINSPLETKKIQQRKAIEKNELNRSLQQSRN